MPVGAARKTQFLSGNYKAVTSNQRKHKRCYLFGSRPFLWQIKNSKNKIGARPHHGHRAGSQQISPSCRNFYANKKPRQSPGLSVRALTGARV